MAERIVRGFMILEKTVARVPSEETQHADNQTDRPPDKL
tara:strand:- start:435 stop:551 length:117 start_codon:yes stop_codon:yes gene_type:complete